MADDFLALDSPVEQGGIETVRFFNGRLLSGRDMGREQEAARARAALAANAIGAGVVHGLEVSQTPADRAETEKIITVKKGLAINASGDFLHLPGDQRIALTRTDSTDFGTSDCTFGICTKVDGGSYVAGEGLYLLVVSPQSREAGRASVNGLPGDSAACNIDRDIASVAFRLIEIRSHLFGSMSQASATFQNSIAYRCFGAGVLDNWPVNLGAQGRRDDDLLSTMMTLGLTGHDVPLALIAFTGVLDIQFIDNWAVRRPCSLADPVSAAQPVIASLTAPRRHAVGRAMLQQFQDQLEVARATATVAAPITARTHFPHLPPAGLLPNMSADQAKAFLAGMTVRGPVHLNAPQVEALFRESMDYPAFASASSQVVWLYAVAENLIEGAKAAADPKRPQPYMIFACGNMPYRTDARFNLHRWNYANFALAG